MSTRSIDIMLSRPGIYVILTPGCVGLVEVEDGRCWQLTLTDYSREGELVAGGWCTGNISAILGPFARATALHQAGQAKG